MNIEQEHDGSGSDLEIQYEEESEHTPEPELLSLQEKIVKLQEKKASLKIQVAEENYVLEFDDFPSAKARSTQTAKVKKLQEQLETLTITLKALLPDPVVSVDSYRTKRANGPDIVEMQKKCLRIAGTMKKFTPKDEPELFWHKFQQSCENYQLIDRESVMVLHALLGEHSDALTWYSTTVHQQVDSVKLKDLKTLFYTAFLEADWQTARLMQLMDIRYRKGETVKQFIQRFSALMQANEFGWSQEVAERAFLKHVMFYKCPYSVQRILVDKTPADFDSCASLAKALMKYVGVPEDVIEVQLCDRCSRQTGKDRVRYKSKAKGDHSDPKSFCEIHGECNHTTKDCLKRKRKENETKESREESRANKKRQGLCMADGCKEKYTPEHAAVCEFRKRKPTLKKMDAQESDTDMTNDQLNNDIDVVDLDRDFFLFKRQDKTSIANGFVFAPIEIEGKPLYAGIVSMANVSFLSPSMVSSLCLNLEKTSTSIQLGEGSTQVPCIGRTPSVEVAVGSKKFRNQFLVLDLGKERYRMYFGY
jgi:hypothetical protein